MPLSIHSNQRFQRFVYERNSVKCTKLQAMIVKHLSSLEGIIVVSIKRKCFGLLLRQKD